MSRQVDFGSTIKGGAIAGCRFSFEVTFDDRPCAKHGRSALVGAIDYHAQDRRLSAHVSVAGISFCEVKPSSFPLKDWSLVAGDVTIRPAGPACAAAGKVACGTAEGDLASVVFDSEGTGMTLVAEFADDGGSYRFPLSSTPDPLLYPALWAAGKATHDDCVRSLPAPPAAPSRRRPSGPN